MVGERTSAVLVKTVQVEIIFKPYYFVKLFGSINRQKEHLAKLSYFYLLYCNRRKFALLH